MTDQTTQNDNLNIVNISSSEEQNPKEDYELHHYCKLLKEWDTIKYPDVTEPNEKDFAVFYVNYLGNSIILAFYKDNVKVRQLSFAIPITNHNNTDSGQSILDETLHKGIPLITKDDVGLEGSYIYNEKAVNINIVTNINGNVLQPKLVINITASVNGDKCFKETPTSLPSNFIYKTFEIVD